MLDKNNKFWEEVVAGSIIPSFETRPSYINLFMFSAVTWNRHMIHYNQDYASHDGLKNVVVHRALMGNYLTQLLTNWVGEFGSLKKIEWSVRGSAYPGDKIICKGCVKEILTIDGQDYVDCEIKAVNEAGDLLAPATARILKL